MRFGIIGAGAIGCLFGAKLKLAGHDVTLVHRDPSTVRAIHKNGVSVREIDGRVAKVRVPIRRGPTRLPGIEILIVAVKAYDTKLVASSYRGKVRPEITVLSLQNGIGNVEALQTYLKNEILAGSTTEGALSSGPGFVIHTGKGLTLIGSWELGKDKCSQIKIAFDSAGLRTNTSSNIRGVLWTKAIINAAINPLSSLTRLPNGAIASSRALQEIARKVIDEGISVSQSARIKLVGDPRKLWRTILLSTRANKSSMLQDIERGKMTEIRQLNGAILAQGIKTRVKTPVNEILTRLTLALEESQRR